MFIVDIDPIQNVQNVQNVQNDRITPDFPPNLGPSTTTQHPLILSTSTYPNVPITFSPNLHIIPLIKSPC